MNDDDIFQQAIDAVDKAEPDAAPATSPANAAPPASSPSTATAPETTAPKQPYAVVRALNGAEAVWRSMGAGIGKAALETKDFFVGEPAEEDKWAFRRSFEGRAKELSNASPVNAAAMGVSQFVTGMVGVGKIAAPLKVLQKSKTAFEMGKAAVATGLVMDPHEQRLSDLIQSVPALRNPVTAYLASDPTDSAAEGRFKNAVEGLGIDLALIGAVKAFKLLRRGEPEGIAQAMEPEEVSPAVDVDAPYSPGARVTEEATPPSVNDNTPAMNLGAPANDTGGEPLGAGRQADIGVRTGDEPGAMPPKAANQNEQIDAAKLPETGPANDNLTPGAVRAADEVPATPGSAASPSAISADEAAQAMARGEVTDEALGAILKSTDAELSAIKRYGSREAAAEAGQVALRSTTSLPWQKLRGTDEVMTFMETSARVLKSQMDIAKGGDILSDARVSSMVQARADMFGEDPAMLMGQITKAGNAAGEMVANMEAGYLLANRMFQDTYDLAFRIRNGMEADTVRATGELKARLSASADLLASARSMSSNAGRALRRMRGQFQFSPEDVQKIKAVDPEKLADLIYQTKGDPQQLMRIADPSFLTRVMDEAAYSLTNSLLWLWPTHVVNIASNLYMLAGRPTEKLLGSLAVGSKRGGNALRSQAIREYAYTASSLGDAWTAMKDAFVRGDSILSPHNTETFQGGTSVRTAQQPLPWKPVNGVLDLAQNAWMAANYRNIVGLPTRTLGAADEFFKTLRYRAYVQAGAAVEANAKGLKGEEFRRFVGRELEKAIDPATGQALDQRALQEAQVSTFQQELLSGTLGATIQQARARHPVLTFVMPFVKTPVNVLRYGWKMTPGLNLLQREYKTDFFGGSGTEQQAQAMGQMALGMTFSALSALLALNGRITGGGPSDPALQKELRATGWQPYAYVVEGGDGSRKYIPMGRVDPAGMTMSIVADLVEMMRLDPEGSDAEKGIGAIAMTLAKAFSDRTFLQSMHQALEALSDPSGDRAERYLASIAGSAIPLSSALRGLNPDPYLREARGFVDSLKRGLPGLSETLPKAIDVWGDPVERSISLLTSQESDLVEAENNRLMVETGKSIGRVSPIVEGLDLRDITLKNGQNAYERLQVLSGHIPGYSSLKQHLLPIIRAEAYQDMEDGAANIKGTRLYHLGQAVQTYRDAARRALIVENLDVLSPLVRKRQQEAMGAYQKSRERRQAQQSGSQQILDALRPK